jgi:hypothetical protein
MLERHGGAERAGGSLVCPVNASRAKTDSRAPTARIQHRSGFYRSGAGELAFARGVAYCKSEPGKVSPMISRRTIVLAFAAGILFAGVSPVLAKSRHSNWIRMFDTDNDGTVDLAEAKKAASALFDKLDRDHDGTLDKRELARRLSPKEFAAADPDHDGTLSKDEYLAAVEQRFTAADPDHDGTLDAKELNTQAGQALLRLLK